MKTSRLPLLALLLALAIAGCDTSNDPTVDDLVDDADIALQQGNPQEAVRILEEALQQEPSNKRVKATLAIALVEANDISIADLNRVVNALNAPGSSLNKTFGTNADRCVPDGVNAAGSVFDPTTVEGIQQLIADYPVLARIGNLLTDVLPADLEESTRAQVQAILASAGVETSKTDAILFTYGLSTLLRSFIETFFVPQNNTYVVDPEVTFYRVSGTSTYYGFCASEAKYAQVCTAMQTGIQQMKLAVAVFAIRSGPNNDLVQQGQNAIEALEREIQDC